MSKTGEQSLEFFVGVGIFEFALAIKKKLGKGLEFFRIDRLGARELIKRLFQFTAPRIICLWAARKADNANRVRQLFANEKLVESRDQFAGGKVAASAKNHDRAGLDVFAGRV